MRLATAHCLFQAKDALVGFSLQTAESLFKQGPHAFRDLVLFKEFCWIDLFCNQIRNIQHGITSLRIEDTRPWSTQGFEALYGDILLMIWSTLLRERQKNV